MKYLDHVALEHWDKVSDCRLSGHIRWIAICATILCVLTVCGCTTVMVRSAVPEEKLDTARPYGIDVPVMRVWGDGISQEDAEKVIVARAARMKEQYAAEIARGETIRTDLLAQSGGGADGAFGAGLMAGWSERGDRPRFKVVSGVSTGAIIALFAFLGPEYDDELREIYTTYNTDQLVGRTFFSGITRGTALFNTTGYRRLIEKYIDDEIIEKLAAAYHEDRFLLIGTTNIDASRPVAWNLSAVAASGHPDAKRLIWDVIQASSAIPAAFPPVLIPVVTSDGALHDEMHVDGGATEQVMLVSPAVRISDIDIRLDAKFDRRMWVVINNKFDKPYEPVRPRLFSIAERAASSLIGGSGAGDVYRLYAIAQREQAELNAIAIPEDFSAEPDELFDPAYMRKLYQLGYEAGLSGEGWSPYPPGFAPPRDFNS